MKLIGVNWMKVCQLEQVLLCSPGIDQEYTREWSKRQHTLVCGYSVAADARRTLDVFLGATDQ